jgi:hypothetical protein
MMAAANVFSFSHGCTNAEAGPNADYTETPSRFSGDPRRSSQGGTYALQPTGL